MFRLIASSIICPECWLNRFLRPINPVPLIQWSLRFFETNLSVEVIIPWAMFTVRSNASFESDCQTYNFASPLSSIWRSFWGAICLNSFILHLISVLPKKFGWSVNLSLVPLTIVYFTMWTPHCSACRPGHVQDRIQKTSLYRWLSILLERWR